MNDERAEISNFTKQIFKDWPFEIPMWPCAIISGSNNSV